MKATLPKKYKEILEGISTYAAKLDVNTWLVGGSVRDFYLRKDTLDIDISFEGNPEPAAGYCIRTWGGEKHKFSQFGTFRVQLETGLKLDFVRARKEKYERPGVLPSVEPADIKEDLFRRDFTVNAMAVSLTPKNFGEYYDPFGGKKDIDAGLIRILHEKSFLDDPTRMFRAVRLAGRFGWKLAPKTEKFLQQAVKEEYPLLLTRERLCHELMKMLEEKDLRPIFELLQQYDMLKFFYPGCAWHEGLAKHKQLNDRLGILVCSLREWGEDFLNTLHLRKELSQEILGAWRALQSQRASLVPFTPLQSVILRALNPTLKKSALEPCFIKGSELKELGLTGRKISGQLEQVCRLQWEGKITSREEGIDFVSKKK